MAETSEFYNNAALFISKEEGFPRNGKAYWDPRDQRVLVSIGYGHQIKPNEYAQGYIAIGNEKIPIVGVRGIDTVITATQAKQLLAIDVPRYVDSAKRPLSVIWDRLTENQKIALTSYAYNVGSTKSLVKYNFLQDIQTGNITAAADTIRDKGIRTASGKVLNALVNRRAKEADLFRKDSVGTQGATTTSTLPTSEKKNISRYIEQTYKDPFKTNRDVQNEILNKGIPQFNEYLNRLNNLGVDYNTSAISNNLTILTEEDLRGDLLLIDGINKTQVKRQEEISNVVNTKLKIFSPDAKYSLINSRLFEMFPDAMRNKMSANSMADGVNPNYAHAWRAPGKLSITADFTIPGISGLRIGQIFWIDRISSAYKEYGAFQLFGLTENIDIGKGWTTSIHSRFNALPRKAGKVYLVDSTSTGNTIEAATRATPRN